MCAAVVNTKDDGEGSIDSRDNFDEWLRAQKAPQSLITKMKQFGMDSIEFLQEIDVNDKQELKNLSNEIGLSTTERIKFQMIIKNVPQPTRNKLNVLVDPEERKVILEMEAKFKEIEESMTNINDAKNSIQIEVQKCSKLIATTYGDIVKQVIKRQESLLVQLKEISNKKLAKLDKAYEQIKANSIIASSHIDSCYTAVSKKVDFNAIDRRKDNILSVGKIVNEMGVVKKGNSLIKSCNIDFMCNSQKVIEVINQSGHFTKIPAPILVSVQSVFGKVKLQWKLDAVDAELGKDVNKLRVGCCDVELKNADDEQLDDLKVDWNFEKIMLIDVNNINKDNNECELGVFKPGDYLVRLQCMINDKQSRSSNVKLLSVSKATARFIWNNAHASGALIYEDGTRVKSVGNDCPWISVTSNTGWNSGTHCWKIKCHTRYSHNHDGVGVTTDAAGAKQCVQLRVLGISVLHYQGYIYNNKQTVGTVDKWKAGDIMTIYLDCETWKITFTLNDKQLGTFDLVANKTYYPALSMCGCEGYDFELLN